MWEVITKDLHPGRPDYTTEIILELLTVRGDCKPGYWGFPRPRLVTELPPQWAQLGDEKVFMGLSPEQGTQNQTERVVGDQPSGVHLQGFE